MTGGRQGRSFRVKVILRGRRPAQGEAHAERPQNHGGAEGHLLYRRHAPPTKGRDLTPDRAFEVRSSTRRILGSQIG